MGPINLLDPAHPPPSPGTPLANLGLNLSYHYFANDNEYAVQKNWEALKPKSYLGLRITRKLEAISLGF